MGTTTKNKATVKKKVAIDKNVKDYSSDLFFVKKREAALKLLKKSGLPDSFKKKKR
jgi:hypothetical protein